jgi:hypothetical protein
VLDSDVLEQLQRIAADPRSDAQARRAAREILSRSEE